MSMDSASQLGTALLQSRHAPTWQEVIDATNRAALLDVADYLETHSVARWQAVNVETKVAFDTCYETGTVWQNCAESQFPQLLANEELFEGEHRKEFLRCHAMISRAIYAPGSMLIINTIEEASLLEGRLRTASDFCKAHQLAHGRDAHVLLGNFQLMTSATGTRFEFGSEGTPLIAGLPAGVLKLILSLDDDRLISHAEYAQGRGYPFEAYTDAKSVQLTANIWSCDPGFDLFCEQVPLTLDGVKRSSKAGQWTNNSIQLDSDNSSTQPVLCVLALMEGEGTERRE
eukprot:TRINITY_DN2200_c0_g5_i1.p1 TRINITY_DN2200_c0_g5~~TRINITY_DN2200_c0_g5_i1.p1  ORF type:complete len:287 (-),score=35.41 TRINITY_DN2200_c0_g5_i1:199-1059(-)